MGDGKVVAGGAIALWMSLSMSVIFFNAAILKTYRHPIALPCWHMVVSCIFVGIIQLVKPGLLVTGNPDEGVPPLDVRRSVELGLPVALVAGLGLVTSNAAYMYLTISFIQMIKAWTSSCVYIMACLLGTQKWSVPVAKTLITITLGLTVASIGELKFNAFGFCIQVLSMLCEAARINQLEIRLKSNGYKLNPLSSTKIFAPLIMVVLGVCVLLMDRSALDADSIRAVGFGMFTFNGAVACMLNLSVFLVIQVANGLIYALSGVAKDLLIICGSALFRGDAITGLQVLGYSIAVLGVQAYAQVSKSPSDFEAGVYPELARRLWACIRPAGSTAEDCETAKDKSRATDQELRSIVGATMTDDDEEHGQEPSQNKNMVWNTTDDLNDDSS